MSIYDTTVKKPQIQLYNNIMNSSQIFKLKRVNVSDLANNESEQCKIFMENMAMLNRTNRKDMIDELNCLERLLISYYESGNSLFNMDVFGEDAKYRVDVNGNKHTFSTKLTGIKVITTIDIIGESGRTAFFIEKVNLAKESLIKLKRVGIC